MDNFEGELVKDPRIECQCCFLMFEGNHKDTLCPVCALNPRWTSGSQRFHRLKRIMEVLPDTQMKRIVDILPLMVEVMYELHEEEDC